MCMGMEFAWEWEHKYAEMGMGIEHLTMRMATFSCMMYAKIPIGPLTLVNFGARYGQFDVTRELPDRTHWLGMFQI